MKTSSVAQSMPTAHVAINKSRLKAYNATTEPTYYLKNGSEFQIELFNPTSGTILAKIKLDGEFITQGGLVLRPGERVFLERYIDVAKKFLFETYEVSGKNEEVKAAIKNNGNLHVEFFREVPAVPYFNNPPIWVNTGWGGGINRGNDYVPPYNSGTPYLRSFTTNTSDLGNHAFYSSSVGGSNIDYSTSINDTLIFSNSDVTMDWMSQETDIQASKDLRSTRSVKSKSIETGRVEKGSNSKQKLDTVDKTFQAWSFHTVEAKILPISQKVNAVEDTIKAYCTNCGCKQKKGFKFCPTCGTKN